MSRVRKKYVRPPRKVAPWPPNGFQNVRKVSKGDTWRSLQLEYGLASPWTLIKYNFGTDDPYVVNWYLESFVGCDTTDYERKVYRFSDTNTPGLIYIPPYAAPNEVRSQTVLD